LPDINAEINAQPDSDIFVTPKSVVIIMLKVLKLFFERNTVGEIRTVILFYIIGT
jgi:hypothetical protein